MHCVYSLERFYEKVQMNTQNLRLEHKRDKISYIVFWKQTPLSQKSLHGVQLLHIAPDNQTPDQPTANTISNHGYPLPDKCKSKRKKTGTLDGF